MIAEPAWSETAILFSINAIGSMICSQIHKSLYFLLGLNFWAMHFGHYLLTFLVLLVAGFLSLFPRQPIPWKLLVPLSVSEFLISVAACIVHAGGSDGTVYTMRVTDGVVTLLIVLFAKHFIDATNFSFLGSQNLLLVIIVAISSSVAWFEPIMYYNAQIALFVWPMVSIATAFHFMLVFETAQKLNLNPLNMSLYICGATSLLMSPFALIFTSDKFSTDSQDVVTSWETIDYFVILLSCVFVSGMMTTRYMLLCKLTPESYAVSRHSKYLLASFGQWLLHNMDYITIFSVLGKMIASASIGAYLWQRWRQAHVMIEQSARNII